VQPIATWDQVLIILHQGKRKQDLTKGLNLNILEEISSLSNLRTKVKMWHKIVFLVGQDNQSPKGDEVIEVTLPKPRSHRRKQNSNSNNASETTPFRYSVSYFAWTLSDSEEDDVQSITLPLKNLKLEKRANKQAN